MPHHHLKHLLGYTLAKYDGTGKSVPGNMAGQRELASQRHAHALQELVVLLYRVDDGLVLRALQYLLRVGQDGHHELFTRLQPMAVDVVASVEVDDVLFVIEVGGIRVCHARENLEEEEVEILPAHVVCRIVSHLHEFLHLLFREMWTLSVLAPFVDKPLVGVFLDETETEGGKPL